MMFRFLGERVIRTPNSDNRWCRMRREQVGGLMIRMAMSFLIRYTLCSADYCNHANKNETF